RNGATEGYVFFTPRPHVQDMRYDLAVSDLTALTPGAGRRLLAFLAAHRSLADRAIWNGSPAEPLLGLLAEQHFEVVGVERWMLRVVDVARALEARGYPAGLEAELQLDVRDDRLPGNAGRWVLEVSEGRGRVRSGGRGRVR